MGWPLLLQGMDPRVHGPSSFGSWALLPCAMWNLNSLIRDGTWVSGRPILNHWTTKKVLCLIFLSSLQLLPQARLFAVGYSGFNLDICRTWKNIHSRGEWHKQTAPCGQAEGQLRSSLFHVCANCQGHTEEVPVILWESIPWERVWWF